MATSGITVSVMEQSIRSIGKRSRPVWVILKKKSKHVETRVFKANFPFGHSFEVAT